MHPILTDKHAGIAEICRRYDVRRLEVFGSAARGEDFSPQRSDVDFLVEFQQDTRAFDHIGRMMSMEEALQKLLQHPVDLIERRVIEKSHNYIRRHSIMSDLQAVYRRRDGKSVDENFVKFHI